MNYPAAYSATLIFSLGSQDIFRKYPHSYEAVIPTLCANLDELDEPEAKASLIWIIGEYAEKIENADELLAIFLDGFKEESYAVSRFVVIALAAREQMLKRRAYLSGATANRDSHCEAVLKETGSRTSDRAASAANRNKGFGQSRCQGQGVCLLETALHRPRSCKGKVSASSHISNSAELVARSARLSCYL